MVIDEARVCRMAACATGCAGVCLISCILLVVAQNVLVELTSMVPFMFSVGPNDLCMCGLFCAGVVCCGVMGYARVVTVSARVMTA